MPEDWWISRLCEEFGCLPSQAIREYQSAPCGLLETILLYRTYARSHRAWHSATSKDQLPDDLPLRGVIEALVEEAVTGE